MDACHSTEALRDGAVGIGFVYLPQKVRFEIVVEFEAEGFEAVFVLEDVEDALDGVCVFPAMHTQFKACNGLDGVSGDEAEEIGDFSLAIDFGVYWAGDLEGLLVKDRLGFVVDLFVQKKHGGRAHDWVGSVVAVVVVGDPVLHYAAYVSADVVVVEAVGVDAGTDLPW